VASAAAITSACLFIFAHKGFYKGGRDKERAFFNVAPLPSGGYVSGGIRW
jgi:hypothetical protein